MPSQDLTILLPLKGRDDFSLRWFRYAASQSLPYKVLVADGGHDEGLEDTLRRDGIFDRIDCKYVRYPFDSSIEIFLRKMADALHRVETPFVVIANNDDFIFFEALATSVAFLKENPDFASSRGEIWDFAVADGSGSSTYGRMTGVRKLYFHPSVAGDSALERVGDMAVKFHSAGHDIVRTPILADIYARIAETGLNDFRFADRCWSFMIASVGKMHRSDNLYMLHQSHSDMSAVTHFGRPSLWIAGPDWDRDLDLFTTCLASLISEIDGVEFYKAKNDVWRMAVRHFLDLVVNDLKREPHKPAPRLRQALLKSAKWLARRHSLLETSARKLRAIRRSRAAQAPLPPSHADRFAGIQQFLQKPRAAGGASAGPSNPASAALRE